MPDIFCMVYHVLVYLLSLTVCQWCPSLTNLPQVKHRDIWHSMPISSLLLIHHTHHIFHSYVTNSFHRSVLPSIGSKIVQVIRVYDKLNAIVINDRKHFVTVFLTDHACKEYRRDYESLDTLINSIAKINEFHVSKLMQC